MTIQEFLEKYGVGLADSIPAVATRVVQIDDAKLGKFDVQPVFAENLLGLLAAVEHFGLGKAVAAEKSLGSGFLGLANSGMDLKARAKGRADREMSPARMRDIAEIWLRAEKPGEWSDYESAVIRGDRKEWLDRCLLDNADNIKTWIEARMK
jgi:hypothetical protein